MSTWIYLECLDHNPPLQAEDESGQHLYNLTQIRADLTDRDRIVANTNDDIWPENYFRRHTARFLTNHPKCRIGIRDEYGKEYPTTDDE